MPQLTKITLGWWEGANEGYLKFEGENIIKKKKDSRNENRTLWGV